MKMKAVDALELECAEMEGALKIMAEIVRNKFPGVTEEEMCQMVEEYGNSIIGPEFEALLKEYYDDNPGT